jgi:hypothetical protein
MTYIRYICRSSSVYSYYDKKYRADATQINSIYKIIQVNNHSDNNNGEQYKLQSCDDGCAGRLVPGFHTSEYRRGYADGQAAF